MIRIQNDREVIQKIRSIDLNNDFETKNIRDLLFQLKTVPVIMCNLDSGNIIVRCRRGSGYTKREDMSYKPSSFCQSYQRATLPGQTAFYGILSADEKYLEDAMIVGIGECSRLSSVESGREDMSFSLWRVKESIEVAYIVSANSYLSSNNSLLETIRNIYREKFSNNIEASFVADFIVGEFSKIVRGGNDNEYKISATWADMFLNEIRLCDAIGYPSVPLVGQAGLNLAIRPDVADSKLVLEKIVDACCYKNSDKIELVWESYLDVINNRRVGNNNRSSDLNEMSERLGVLNANELQLL